MFLPTHINRYLCPAVAALVSCFVINNAALFAQEGDIEYVLDATSTAIPLPDIFKPSMDLSGRGFHSDPAWPQSLAHPRVLDIWHKDIGMAGLYRLQYNLWEISELSGNRALQEKLIANYEALIKRVNDSGGVVMLNIFSTPQGQGKVLDKKSSPVNLKAFKATVKDVIRYFSCIKRYTIWYEVWTAPDLDDFFLGRQQEYLNLYRAVAEAVKELEAEFKISIPVGGPSSSWWFRSVEGNTNVTPERSLTYELIKFCYHYRLPLDFITWHAYSTDPKCEKEMTAYNKTSIALMRDWLIYFKKERVLLIVDEWNYDNGVNLSAERRDRVFVSASYIPARLKHMYEAGIDHQVFFSLEDFQYNKEGVERNVGVFWFTPDPASYNGGPKSTYNVWRQMSLLGGLMYVHAPNLTDEFVGVIATKGIDKIALLVYNYIDSDIFRNYVSRNIALLNEHERRSLLSVIRSDKLDKIMRRQLDAGSLQAPKRVKAMLKKAQELNEMAAKFSASVRNIRIVVKNLKDEYTAQRYIVDSGCNSNCEMTSQDIEQSVSAKGSSISMALNPYSVNLVVLTKKGKEEIRPQEIEKALEEAAMRKEVPQEQVSIAAEGVAGPQKSKDSDKPSEMNNPKESIGQQGQGKTPEHSKPLEEIKPTEEAKPISHHGEAAVSAEVDAATAK